MPRCAALGALQGFGVTNTSGPLSVEVTEESQAAQVKQLQVLAKSQQRQILEHQEALARLHGMIRETQQAQVGVHPSHHWYGLACLFSSPQLWPGLVKPVVCLRWMLLAKRPQPRHNSKGRVPRKNLHIASMCL